MQPVINVNLEQIFRMDKTAHAKPTCATTDIQPGVPLLLYS